MCLLKIPQRRASDLESKFVLVFVEAAKHQILGGDQLLVILCGYGTKSLELGTSFLSMTMLFVDRGTRSVPLLGADTPYLFSWIRRIGQNLAIFKPFVDISNMTHDPPEGVVRFTNRTDEIAYKLPHKIEHYNSLSDLEKEHTKSVYLRNEEDKRRGVEYVMSKILGFYKECLELGPEYVTGMDDEGEVT
ncbi:hypothetical protein Tco_0645228 [Tanacetum coccineum]